jgi:hypothetical protein
MAASPRRRRHLMARDFSLDAYREILTRARDAGYEFASFLDAPEENQKRLYLRHDVDYSLSIAARLAGVNQSLDVRGTFFVLLRSDMYNLFSPSSMAAVRSIQDAGQWIALHVVVRAQDAGTDGELAALVKRDYEIVDRHITGVQPAFSWHNPTPELLQRGLQLATPGLVNAYGARLFKDIRYSSDSVMRRSPDELLQTLVAEPARALQLLLHPLYWVIGGRDPVDVLARVWMHIIRDREPEMQANGAWAAANPNGISERALECFSAALLASAMAGPAE